MLLNVVLQAKQWLFLATGKEQEGQGLVEYALIILLIAIAVIGVLMALGTGIGNTFQNIINQLANPGVTPEP